MQFIRAIILNRLASWSLFRGDYRRAILRFESLRQIIEKRHGYGHIKTAPTLYRLALAYHRSAVADNFRFAIYLYLRVLNILEASNDSTQDRLIGNVAEAMGDWYAQIAHYEMAAASYQKSIEAFDRFYGPSTQYLLEPLYSRAKALRILGRREVADQLTQWAARIEAAQAIMTVSYEYHRNDHHF